MPMGPVIEMPMGPVIERQHKQRVLRVTEAVRFAAPVSACASACRGFAVGPFFRAENRIACRSRA